MRRALAAVVVAVVWVAVRAVGVWEQWVDADEDRP